LHAHALHGTALSQGLSGGGDRLKLASETRLSSGRARSNSDHQKRVEKGPNISTSSSQSALEIETLEAFFEPFCRNQSKKQAKKAILGLKPLFYE
jgi:hypothetical protein